MDNVSKLILEILRAKRCTQYELAKQLKVSQNLVSRWLLGKAKPTPDNLQKIQHLHTVLTRY